MSVTVSRMSVRALDAVLEEFLMFTMPVFIFDGGFGAWGLGFKLGFMVSDLGFMV